MENIEDTEKYLTRLQNCKHKNSIHHGIQLQTQLTKTGLLVHNHLLANSLISLYLTCNYLQEACRLFWEIPNKNIRSIPTIISALCKSGSPLLALEFYRKSRNSGINANQFITATILPACGITGHLKHGKCLHQEAVKNGFISDVFVSNALIDMYGKCHKPDIASQVFVEMPTKSPVSWSTIIRTYSNIGDMANALEIFKTMPHESRSLFSETIMIMGLAENGMLDDALEIFKSISCPDVASCNAMISCLVKNGRDHECIGMLKRMLDNGARLSPQTFPSVLCACGDVNTGMQIHGSIIRYGFHSNVTILNSLMDMYVKCGFLQNARQVFDRIPDRDIISWTTIMAGYSRNGYAEEVVEIFREMHASSVVVDASAFTSVLPACGELGLLEQVHSKVIALGLLHVDYILKNALIDKYMKCSAMENANLLSEDGHEKDVVSWTAMIAGYVQNGFADKSIEMFYSMLSSYVKPNFKTFATVLSACAELASLKHGIIIHGKIFSCGFDAYTNVANALIIMYAKCGILAEAQKVFESMQGNRDVVSWTSMIAGFAMHGQGNKAIDLFEEMKNNGIVPDQVTLVSVLSACCHAGRLEKGIQFFSEMTEVYKLKPATEHYSCMVDLFGRTGHLKEAQELISKMPMEPDINVLSSLLGACRVYHDVELAESVAYRIFELDPQNPSPYVLLSNIYAASYCWDKLENVRQLMKGRGVRKEPGCSWIEIGTQVYAFTTDLSSHQEQ